MLFLAFEFVNWTEIPEVAVTPLKVTRARFVWGHVLIQRVRAEAEEFGALFKLFQNSSSYVRTDSGYLLVYFLSDEWTC